MIPTKTIHLDFWRHPTDILHLVQGESNGRNVTFKITDNGAAFDLTGYAVQFAVNKPDGNIVVNSATVTDAEGGIVDVVISSQVVAVAGNLHAELQITKTGQLSKSFRIVTKVAPGVDVDGIEPSVSEFGVLQTLIGQVESTNAQLAQTQQQFSQAVGAVTSDSEVVMSRGGYPVLYERLNSADGIISNVEKNVYMSLDNEYITKLVIPDTSPSDAKALLDSLSGTPDPKTVIFDVEIGKEYKVTIKGAHDRFRAVGATKASDTHWNEKFIIDDTITSDYSFIIKPVTSRRVFIYLSTNGETPLVEVLSNDYRVLPKDTLLVNGTTVNVFDGYHDDNIIISSTYVTKSTILTSDNVNTAIVDIMPGEHYTVRAVGGTPNRWSVGILNEPTDLSIVPTFVAGDPSSFIELDRILTEVNSTTYKEIDFFNTSGKQLFIYASSTNQNIELEILTNEYVFKNNVKTNTENVFSKYVYGNYSSPDLPAVTAYSPLYLEATNSNNIYAMFDDLMVSYPNYITKSLLGNEPVSNLPIYQYSFSPSIVENGRDSITPSQAALPKILIGGCIHGNEKQSTWSIIKLFEDICNEWSKSATLEFLRHNVKFEIIPIVNPHGYDNNSRFNGNGIDPNREFLKLEANMQVESLIYKRFIDENIDANYFIDCHTMWAGRDRETCWLMSPNHVLDDVANRVIKKVTRIWKFRYPFITYGGLMGYVGYPEYDIPGGTDTAAVFYAHNNGLLNSAWVEFAAHVNYPEEPYRYGKLTTNMYVDFLGNLITSFGERLGATNGSL